MKAKLTPKIAYLIGLWKARRTKEGIGIGGNQKICNIFIEHAIKAGVAQADKIQIREPEPEEKKEDDRQEGGLKAEVKTEELEDKTEENKEVPAVAIEKKEEITEVVKKNDDTPATAQEEKKEFQAEMRKPRTTKVFFYHSAYRAFFDDVVKNRLERFKYKNEFAAQYLAGMFDGCGGVGKKEEIAYFSSLDKTDEMILLRLNFRLKRMGKKVFVGKKEFFSFAGGYLKYFK